MDTLVHSDKCCSETSLATQVSRIQARKLIGYSSGCSKSRSPGPTNQPYPTSNNFSVVTVEQKNNCLNRYSEEFDKRLHTIAEIKKLELANQKLRIQEMLIKFINSKQMPNTYEIEQIKRLDQNQRRKFYHNQIFQHVRFQRSIADIIRYPDLLMTSASSEMLPKVYYYCCKLCPFETACKKSLIDHYSHHESIFAYQCPYCSFNCQTKGIELDEHINIHFKPRFCELAGVTFDNGIRDAEKLKQFLNVNNGIDGNFAFQGFEFDCKFCSRSFAFENDLIQHEDMHPVRFNNTGIGECVSMYENNISSSDCDVEQHNKSSMKSLNSCTNFEYGDIYKYKNKSNMKVRLCLSENDILSDNDCGNSKRQRIDNDICSVVIGVSSDFSIPVDSSEKGNLKPTVTDELHSNFNDNDKLIAEESIINVGDEISCSISVNNEKLEVSKEIICSDNPFIFLDPVDSNNCDVDYQFVNNDDQPDLGIINQTFGNVDVDIKNLLNLDSEEIACNNVLNYLNFSVNVNRNIDSQFVMDEQRCVCGIMNGCNIYF